MIPSRSGIGRQEGDIWQVVAAAESKCLKIDDARNNDRTIELHVVSILQIAGQACGTNSAVAFAEHKLGTQPTLVLGGPIVNKLPNASQVLLVAMELRFFFPVGRARISSANRIDENQIGYVEQAQRVFLKRIRSPQRRCIIREPNTLWAEHP